MRPNRKERAPLRRRGFLGGLIAAGLAAVLRRREKRRGRAAEPPDRPKWIGHC